MALKYSIEHQDSLLRVTVTGSPDYLELDQLWRDIVVHCKRHQCLKVLGESRTAQWQDTYAYDHAAIFDAAGLSRQCRIAWVEESPEAKKAIKLAEAVVKNRGFETARAFSSVAEAKRWLAKEPAGHS